MAFSLIAIIAFLVPLLLVVAVIGMGISSLRGFRLGHAKLNCPHCGAETPAHLGKCQYCGKEFS